MLFLLFQRQAILWWVEFSLIPVEVVFKAVEQEIARLEAVPA